MLLRDGEPTPPGVGKGHQWFRRKRSRLVLVDDPAFPEESDTQLSEPGYMLFPQIDALAGM